MASVSSSSNDSRSAVPGADSTRWASNMVRGASVQSCQDATSGSPSNCVSAGNADVAPLSDSSPRVRAHALFGPLQQVRPDRLDAGCPLLHHGQWIRIVVQPLAHADAHVAPDDQQPTAVGERGRLGDDGARPHRHALVTPADLGAPLDEDHPEARIAGETVAREGPIARLEYVEGDLRVGVEDSGKGEHTQAFERLVPGFGIGHRHPIVTRVERRQTSNPPTCHRPPARAGPAPKAGPVLVSLVLCTQLPAPAFGVGCEGRVVGRPEHAPARTRPQ